MSSTRTAGSPSASSKPSSTKNTIAAWLGLSPTDEPGTVAWFLVNSPDHAAGGRFNQRALFEAYHVACKAHDAPGLCYLSFCRDLGPFIITQTFCRGETMLTLTKNGKPVPDPMAVQPIEVALAAFILIGYPTYILGVLRQVGWI
jgi:hypothetical protein